MLIEYGMLSDDKFFERAQKFALVKTVDGNYHTLDELQEKLGELHRDKDGNLIVLYAGDVEAQHAFIKKAEAKGYQVVFLETPLTPHYVQKLESALDKVRFTRVDSAPIEQLIPKTDEENSSKLDETQKDSLKKTIEEMVDKAKFSVSVEDLSSDDDPVMITMPEFIRRMKEMEATGGGGFYGMGNLPETYNLVWNANHELTTKILDEKDEGVRKEKIEQAKDLAMLNQRLLKGEALEKFIKRSYSLI